jgi:hypothetical protein
LNGAEYVPLFAMLSLWFATRPTLSWIEAVIVDATSARFLIVAGLLRASRSTGRTLRASLALHGRLTCASGFALAVGPLRT